MSNTPIETLEAELLAEHADMSTRAAFRLVKTMPDSHARVLLYRMATEVERQEFEIGKLRWENLDLRDDLAKAMDCIIWLKEPPVGDQALQLVNEFVKYYERVYSK